MAFAFILSILKELFFQNWSAKIITLFKLASFFSKSSCKKKKRFVLNSQYTQGIAIFLLL